MLNEKLKILKEYELDESTSFNFVHDGIDNNTYLLTDANGKKYVLRESKRNNDSKNINFEIDLLLALSQSSLNVSKPIASVNNSYYVFDNNKYRTLFSYIDGHQFETVGNKMLSKNIVRLGGKKLGELHSITNNIKVEVDSKRTIFTEFDRLLSVPIEKLSRFDGHDELLKDVKKFYDDAQILAKDKKNKCGIIHNDYRIQNLIFSKKNTDAAIIDFDWSCRGPFLKDVGLAIAEWSIFDFNRGPSKEAIQQFIDGYNATGPIHVEYDEKLLFWICFSCLSDVCTFFSDVLESRYESISINKIDQCRMYKKFKYFIKELIDSSVSNSNGLTEPNNL